MKVPGHEFPRGITQGLSASWICLWFRFVRHLTYFCRACFGNTGFESDYAHWVKSQTRLSDWTELMLIGRLVPRRSEEATFSFRIIFYVCGCVLNCFRHVWLFVTARRLCPWDSPGKNTGVGCHSLLQGIVPTQGLKQQLLCPLHWLVHPLPLAPPGKPCILCTTYYFW